MIFHLVTIYEKRSNFFFVQVTVAGYTAGQRAKHVPHGKYIAGASILVGTTITMLLLVLLNVFPFTPQYMIPIAGMMVGNSMTVTGVTMKRLRDDIRTQMNLVSLNNICHNHTYFSSFDKFESSLIKLDYTSKRVKLLSSNFLFETFYL